MKGSYDFDEKRTTLFSGGRPKPTRAMPMSLHPAMRQDVPELASFHSFVNRDLARRSGKDRWSSPTVKGLLFAMRSTTIFLARRRGSIIAAFALSRRKPWAIDKSYFAPSSNPLYLTGMAVHPLHQRKGIGRLCIEQARSIALRWPGDAIRLDAYDNQTGAGEFYRKCGFTEVGRAQYREIPLIYFEMLLAPERKGPAVRRAQK